MLEENINPSAGNAGAEINEDSGHDPHNMLDTDGAIQAYGPLIEQKRQAVAEWNERVAAFRAQTDAPIPQRHFIHHPAFDDLIQVGKRVFVGSGQQEMADHVTVLLSKVSKAEDGTLLFDGEPRDVFQAWIDGANRARKVASERGDIAACGLADQNYEWGSHLDFLLWDDGVAPNLPIAIGIREASYG